MIYALLSLLIIAADQWLKCWISAYIPYGANAPFIPHFIQLTNVHNTGAAFSKFQGMMPLLLIIAAIFSFSALVFLIAKRIKGFLGNLAIALLIGGALANAIDRFLAGYVVDMFELLLFRFAIFNIADISITLGGLLFCIFVIKTRDPQKPHSNSP